jgi:hypothetical protein
MPVLVRIEAKRPGQRVDHLFRRRDVPALFQPRVPGEADAGEYGDLFPPQAGSAAETGLVVLRQSHVGRPQPCPLSAEKRGQLTTACRA